MAESILKNLSLDFNTQYDVKDAIGRRYRRQDAIGTPFCVTIDHQSVEDETVTLRARDSMTQERIPAAQLSGVLRERVDLKTLLT